MSYYYVSSVRFVILSLLLILILYNNDFSKSSSLLFVTGLKAEWIPIPSKISPRRSGHTSFTTKDSSFVFGGYIEEDDEDNMQSYLYRPYRYARNDLWKWDNNSWKEVKEVTGDIPSPRLASASAVINTNDNTNKAYLFGGWNPTMPNTNDNTILDTVHSFDLNTHEWKKLDITMPDGPTSRHIALALPSKNKILIHDHNCLDYVWIFDPFSTEFTKQPTTMSNNWDDDPGYLKSHTATMLDEDTMLLFGGAVRLGNFKDTTVLSNGSYVLDIRTWEWKQVEIVYDDDNDNDIVYPSPRAGSCLVTYKTNCAILFGGAEKNNNNNYNNGPQQKTFNPKGDVWALHLTTNNDNNKDDEIITGKWELLLDEKKKNDDDDPKPNPRNAATLTPILSSSDATTKFLLTGGWEPFVRTWDDSFILSITE